MHNKLPFPLRAISFARDLVHYVHYVHVNLLILLLMDTFSQKCKYVRYESWQRTRQRQEFLVLVYTGFRLTTGCEVMSLLVAS
jgi:hypothetical protein